MKNIEIKSGVSLFVLVIIELALVLFFVMKNDKMFPLINEIQGYFWTYVNIVTIITLFLALRMGKTAIDKSIKSKNFTYIANKAFFRLSIFIFCGSTIFIEAYNAIFYETYFSIDSLGDLIFFILMTLMISIFVVGIPSLLFGSIYGEILRKISKS